VGRGKHDPEVFSQEKGKDDELHVSASEKLESCREDQSSEGGKEPPAEGKPPPAEGLNGPPESTLVEAEREEVGGRKTATSNVSTRPGGLSAHLTHCKGPASEGRLVPPSIETLHWILDCALVEPTRSYKGPLEQRFDAMMGSIGISRWALLDLKACTEAYEQDDPEIGWVTELLRAQKLAVATVRELEFDARRLRGVQRSLISGIISGPILKWALLGDPEARVKKETLSLRQEHQIVCGLLEALTELRRVTLASWKTLGECKDHFFPRVLADGEVLKGATTPEGSLKPSGRRTASTAPALTENPHQGETEVTQPGSIPERGRKNAAESECEKQREARGSGDAEQDLHVAETSSITKGGANQRRKKAAQVARETIIALERVVWRNEVSQVPDNRGGPVHPGEAQSGPHPQRSG
jgi:hypothetical protein